MPQSCIFTLNSSHVGFANNLILRVDKHFVDTGPKSDVLRSADYSVCFGLNLSN